MEEPFEHFDRDAMTHGLGLAMFMVLGALIKRVALATADPSSFVDGMRLEATAIVGDVISRSFRDDDLFEAAVRENAMGAIGSIFGAVPIGSGAPDERDIVGP